MPAFVRSGQRKRLATRPGMVLLMAVLGVSAACGPGVSDDEPAPPATGDVALPVPSEAVDTMPEEPGPPPLPPAPWDGARLAASAVPTVYVQQWSRAENRNSCALIAPAALGDGQGATPRAATFSGGWAVAYDQPGLRSAFGVAGASVDPSGDIYSDWPFSRDWSDGSHAGYGPEGGSGENQLAYLRITGQGCLYNIWSRLSRSHLEFLLEQLRFVEN